MPMAALTLETVESKRSILMATRLGHWKSKRSNRAKELIEDFMIAANGVTARYLAANDFPSIRRVVRMPKRWERIIEIAWDQHYEIQSASLKALERFSRPSQSCGTDLLPGLVSGCDQTSGSGEYVAEFSMKPLQDTLDLQSKIMPIPRLQIVRIEICLPSGY